MRLPVKVLGSSGSVDEDMPRSTIGLPEVAIVGRSNVGKSTLLNALLYGNQQNTTEPMQKKYVRGKTPEGVKLPKGAKAIVSDKPGETRRITFYQLGSKILTNAENIDVNQNKRLPNSSNKSKNNVKNKMSIVLVDLPGYGFAYASEEKSQEWKELMNHYITNRGKSLKRILFLIDARHGFKKTDFDFLESIQEFLYKDEQNGGTVCKGENNSKRAKVRRKQLPPIQIVLTKCDLVTQNDLARRVVQVRQNLSEALVREPSSLPVMVVSAKAGLGFNNIRGHAAKGGILELQRDIASLAIRPN